MDLLHGSPAPHAQPSAAARLAHMLMWHAIALGSGGASLVLALDAGATWGWVVAGLALAGGTVNVARLARAADGPRTLPWHRD